MAVNAEKSSGYNSGNESDNGSSQGVAIFERPKGLKGLYYNPVTQIVMLGFVCFMCPGEFSGFVLSTIAFDSFDCLQVSLTRSRDSVEVVNRTQPRHPMQTPSCMEPLRLGPSSLGVLTFLLHSSITLVTHNTISKYNK